MHQSKLYQSKVSSSQRCSIVQLKIGSINKNYYYFTTHGSVYGFRVDAPPPPVTKPLEKPELAFEQLNSLKELVLLEKIGYLCEELGDPGRYFHELRGKNVLNTFDTQLIKSKPTNRKKTEEFVTLISRRRSSHGQHGLDVFVEALKKQRVQAHIARTLLCALNKKKAEAEKTSSRKLID